MKRFKLVSKEKPKPKQEKPRKKSAVRKFEDAILQQIKLCKKPRLKDGRYKTTKPLPKSWVEDWSAYDRGFVLVPKLDLDGQQIPFWVDPKTGRAKGIPVDMEQPHPGLAELNRLIEMVAAGQYRTPIYNRLREERKKLARKTKS